MNICPGMEILVMVDVGMASQRDDEEIRQGKRGA